MAETEHSYQFTFSNKTVCMRPANNTLVNGEFVTHGERPLNDANTAQNIHTRLRNG